jgi:ABC-type lipoprotein export system ATPase subunit
MPRVDLVNASEIVRSARVLQLESLFDVPPSQRSEERWIIDAPIEDRAWSIGVIVGPSGAGKSTVARALFGADLVTGYDWPEDRTIVDGFPSAMSIKDITLLLSSVGFSSPPAWLRPFGALSTGQQFRVTLARGLAEQPARLVVDEFTSVVDRTVAQIGSAAVAKTVRRFDKQFVAVTCHYDVLEWLQPDWVLEPHLRRFQWRELQPRPALDLVTRRCRPDVWTLFRDHHYLTADLNRSARCFLTTWRDRPVAFSAVLPSAGFVGCWRGHRTVCLPDFQGIGIGNRISVEIGAIVTAATNGRYRSVTSHPALIRARYTDAQHWRLVKAPSMSGRSNGSIHAGRRHRLAATFEYVGPPHPDDALAREMWCATARNQRLQSLRSSS